MDVKNTIIVNWKSLISLLKYFGLIYYYYIYFYITILTVKIIENLSFHTINLKEIKVKACALL